MSQSNRFSIAVNARFLLPNRIEGIGRFSDEVLKRLVLNMPEVDFHFFFDRPWDKRFIYAKNVIPHVLYPQARHPFLYMAFFELAVPWMLRKVKADIFFSPDGYLSLASKVPQVAVFHDIAFEHFPQDIRGIHAWHYHQWFPKYAQKASRILTVSEFTKQDIVKTYSISPEKIQVVGNGCSETFFPISESERSLVRNQYTQDKPYFLYAGAIQPRKNLDNLLKAFELFRTEQDSDIKLLLTGRKAWNFEEVIRTYQSMKYKDEVIFTGYVSDSELNRLYNGALALVYVSRFEGFGLPILEAMNAGTAVITSNTSSMPEVAGPAGILVNPEQPKSIVSAMKTLATNPQKRMELIEKGFAQKAHFSWEATARECELALREIRLGVNRGLVSTKN
jgi:glycosyltransferase involved in cell wall biosynthesis